LRLPSFFALAEWQQPLVDAVQFEQFEGVQHCPSDSAASVQRIEQRFAEIRSPPLGTAREMLFR
jgi:hypothetical protein